MSRRQVKILLRRGLELMPRGVRDHVARNMLKMDPEPPKGLIVKLAETEDEYAQAFTILHDAYVAEGLMEPNPERMRVTIHHALPGSVVAIAVLDGRVVATGSLITEGPLGLPMGSIFDYEKVSRPGARIAEVSSLAVHEEFRFNRGEMLFPLLGFLHRYAARYAGIDFFVIAVNPKWISFYESILLFDRIQDAPVEGYDFVNGAPAIGAYRDLLTYPVSLAEAYSHLRPEKNVHDLLVSRHYPNFVFPERRYSFCMAPPMALDVMDGIFNRRTGFFRRLDDGARLALWRALPAHYHSLLPEPEGVVRIGNYCRSAQRFQMATHAWVGAPYGEGQLVASLWDASSTGVCLYAPDSRDLGDEVPLTVQVGAGEFAKILAEPMWRDQKGYQGLRVVSADRKWWDMILYLESWLSGAARASRAPARPRLRAVG